MSLEVSCPHARRVKALCAERGIPVAVQVDMKAAYEAFVRDITSGTNTEQVAALNRYRKFVRRLENKYPKILGNKSKYYTSILEEMPILLSQGHTLAEIERLHLGGESLGLGDFDCSIRVYFSALGELVSETKQIDFALVLKMPDGYFVPIVGFEVKKYVDKTMHATFLNTASALRTCRPRTYYGLVVEDEARAEESAQNSEMWDREHVLSGLKRNRSKLNPIKLSEYSNFKTRLRDKITVGLTFICEELARKKEGAVRLLKLRDAVEEDPSQLTLLDAEPEELAA